MLSKLEATDFCCFPSMKVKLKKRGLIWLGGVNEDTASATSNGSGKSTVFKAIGWALYGKAVDGHDGDEVIRHGTKRAETVLTFTEGYVVTRSRRKGAPKLEITREGVPVEGSRDELQALIDRLMGMDWQTFRNVALYGQRDNKRFVNPDTTDRERKEVLGRILNTTIYDVAQGWIKGHVKRLKGEADRIRGEVDKAQARLDEYDLDDLRAREADWDKARRERMKKQGAQARALLQESKELLKDPPDVKALEASLEELREQQRAAKALEADIEVIEPIATKLRQDQFEAATKATVARKAHEAAERAHDKVVTDGDEVCPLCTGSLKTGNAAAHVAELVADLEAKAKALKTADKAHKAAEAAADEKHAELRRARAALKVSREAAEGISDLQDEIAEAKALAARAASKREQARLALETAKNIKAEVNPLAEQIARAEERIAKATEQLRTERAALKTTNHELAHYEFWNNGYSPSGLPSFALDAVMPVLTDYANKYLEVLADGDITVEFSTQRELKSAKGEFRDEIGMEWEIEGIAGLPPSGGQWKKLEIATNFALMDLVASQEGAQSDILLLDEVFDGLDAEGVDRVGHLLQKLRAKRPTIMVISHSATMQEWFERALIVEKRAGASVLTAA